MVVGTSAMIGTELDSIVNQHTDKFCNPVVLLRTNSVARDSSEIHFFQALGNAHAERTEKKRTIADSLCDSGGIQTHNLLIRSQMLYSVELRNLSGASFLNCECKGTMFFSLDQTFWDFFSKKGAFSLVFLPFLSLFTPVFQRRERQLCKMSLNNCETKNAVPHPCLLIYIDEFRYDRLQLEEIRWLSHENILPLQA